MLFRVFWPNGVQNEVFQVLSKVHAWNFSDFLNEVTAVQQNVFSTELCVEGFRRKGAPKEVFGFIEKSLHGTLIFCMDYSSIKA